METNFMKTFLVFCMLVALISLQGFCFLPSNFVLDTREKVDVPILMYHQVQNEKKGMYSITPQQLEADLMLLKNAGFQTVFPSEIISFVESGTKLPERPILLSFDDGHYSTLAFALPLLKKYNAKAVVNVIGAFSEFSTTSGDDSKIEYSHLTWGQIKILEESGHFEIGAHTYNMHKYKERFGISKLKDETVKEYEKNLTKDTNRLEEKLLLAGVSKPQVYAYPFGEYNDEAEKILSNLGYKLFLTCNEGISTVAKGDKNSLYTMKRFNRSSNSSVFDILTKNNIII